MIRVSRTMPPEELCEALSVAWEDVQAVIVQSPGGTKVQWFGGGSGKTKFLSPHCNSFEQLPVEDFTVALKGDIVQLSDLGSDYGYEGPVIVIVRERS